MGSPPAAHKRRRSDLSQSWSHLQATCTLIHTGFYRWLEEHSAAAHCAKIALVLSNTLFYKEARQQRHKLTALAVMMRDVSGSAAIHPQHSQVEPPRGIGAIGSSGFTLHSARRSVRLAASGPTDKHRRQRGIGLSP